MPEQFPFGGGNWTDQPTWAGFIGAALTLIVAIGGSMIWMRWRARR